MPVPTAHVPVDPSCGYRDVSPFQCFHEARRPGFLFARPGVLRGTAARLHIRGRDVLLASETFFPPIRVQRFELVGGVNAPKKVTASDAGGRKCVQLVKSGSDDLRQDAVIQQVFTQVNSLLLSAPETRERALRVQTYKVVPLTPQVGLVEWVRRPESPARPARAAAPAASCCVAAAPAFPGRLRGFACGRL